MPDPPAIRYRTVSRALPVLAVLALAWAACDSSGPTAASISPEELAAQIEAGDAPFILDVRTPGEFAAGHIPGAVNVPHDELAERLSELPAARTEEIVVHCQRGGRAAAAETVLSEAGYTRVLDLDGHFSAWAEGGLPVE